MTRQAVTTENAKGLRTIRTLLPDKRLTAPSKELIGKNGSDGSEGSESGKFPTEILTVELHAVPGDPRPVEIRWRQALKDLLRRHGLRASWPTPEGKK